MLFIRQEEQEMSDSLEIYGYTFPELVMDIVSFFSDRDIKSKFINEKNGLNMEFGFKVPMDFCEYHKKKYYDLKDNRKIMIQPRLIAKICNILWENSILTKIRLAMINDIDGGMGEVFYRPSPLSIDSKQCYISYLNNIVYGFKFIYNTNKSNVLPIIIEKSGRPGIGTCFRTIYGIVTAKHCLEVDKVQIGKNETIISPNRLYNAPIYAMDNYDIAVISIVPSVNENIAPFRFGEPEVLDEVITMGFPKHSGFDNFITTTAGNISAIENSYIYKHDLMLLTTRIRGGNSGGPVINKKGEVVGIVTETPYGEEVVTNSGLFEYDKFGYGLSIPQKYIIETNKNQIPFTRSIEFVDNL